MKKLLILILIIILLIGGYFILIQSKHSAEEINISNASLEEVSSQLELGKTLYYTHCASCHGNNLQGQPKWKTSLDEDGHNYAPPLNGTGHTWHHSEEQLYNIIRYGLTFYNQNYKGKMKGNDQLSDGDVLSILEYIKSVWPESIQKKYKTMTKH
ncbi:cytochrome c [Alphaproteobacteria bacterium]|jgi:mono/diheme cytochrome c family protein|nr:cytochrome c [Alphaproteobacteria bacterium]MDB3973621.1 cytochrome c [Alphaproteobacteria bacterium]